MELTNPWAGTEKILVVNVGRHCSLHSRKARAKGDTFAFRADCSTKQVWVFGSLSQRVTQQPKFPECLGGGSSAFLRRQLEILTKRSSNSIARSRLMILLNIVNFRRDLVRISELPRSVIVHGSGGCSDIQKPLSTTRKVLLQKRACNSDGDARPGVSTTHSSQRRRTGPYSCKCTPRSLHFCPSSRRTAAAAWTNPGGCVRPGHIGNKSYRTHG
jgi:hypothetical protein